VSEQSTVETPAAPAPPEAPVAETAAPLGRRRRVIVWVLVVAASIIAVLSILTVWANRQLLDAHAWHKASASIIQDPKVRTAVSTQLVNVLYDNVNVEQQLQTRLPNNLKGLSGPASAALREPLQQAIDFLLAQPRFQTLFVQASDLAHEKLVNVLENKTGAGIDTGNGVVTLDVSELLKQLGEALGIPTSALDRIPADAATITVLKSDQLSYAQKGVRAVKVLSVWLLVLVLAMYGLALYLARGIRRKTLAHIGWAFVIVGLLVLVARRVLGNYVINAIAQPENRSPAHHVWLIATNIMGQIAWAVIFYGIVIVLAAMVAGATRPAIAIRRWAAPVLNVRPELTWGATVFVWLLLILWGGTHALRTWWGIVLIGGLIAAGVVALRQQTLKEFPEAGLEPHEGSMGARMAAGVSGAAHKVTGAVHRHEHAAEPAAGGGSTADELAKLAELRDKGAISEAEFEQAKKIALSA
jgi:Short C-terminal domain